jgi:nickel-dependent lactate racemase
LVKIPHPIGEISSRIESATDHCVRLTPRYGVASANGSRRERDAASPPRNETDMTLHALAEPLEFPPLAAATVPGDRVAIAVDENVPCVGAVVRGAVEAFQRAGIELEDIFIVTADATTARLCKEALPDEAPRPQVITHDPNDADNLCFIGQTRKHEPLLINRTIFDADVVLPIGCARLGSSSVYESLFPRFSNAETLQRHRAPMTHRSTASEKKEAREIEQAGWLVGVPMVVQVVPGADDSVAHVVAGEPHVVAERVEKLYRRQWLLNSPQQVSLVIAMISGGEQAQTWQNVGRALATAEPLLAEGGAIALCTNLEAPPGESLGRLIGSGDLDKAERKIFHDHGADSLPAWHLARALQRGPVYFLSQLDEETVEDMGLAPISDTAELERLAGRHESCVVIDDSQHAVVKVGENRHDA